MLRRVPLLPVALALMLGIALQHSLGCVTTPTWWLLTAVAGIGVGIMLIVRRKIATWTTLTLLIICILGLGGTLGRRHDPRFNTHDWRSPAILKQVPPGKAVRAYIEVQLKETPQPTKKSWRAKARVTSMKGVPTEGSIRLYLRKDSTAATLRYGDRLLIHGYPDLEQGSIYTTSDHYIVTHRDSTSLRARSERVRIALLHRMQRGPLARHEAGVAEAITLGWRADLDPQTQSSYRDAGIAHLLAVSGLHVGLLAALVGGALFWVNKERKGRIVRGCVQLAAVWAFCLLTGLAPSTVRAAMMFSLFIVSNMLNRNTPKMNLLAATALITLAVQPMLLYDIGWQLSYAAVSGILLARPLLSLYRNILWQTAVVSSAATLATMPITLHTFHRLQPYFLISNDIIVPLAAFILGFALLYMALPCGATAWAVGTLLRATEWVTAKVSALPFAVIEIAEPSAWLTAAVAVAVTAIFLGIYLSMTRAAKADGSETWTH